VVFFASARRRVISAPRVKEDEELRGVGPLPGSTRET
jgi:hypothetical protein